MAIKVYKGGSWVNTTGVSAIGKADRLAIGQTDTSLATSDKSYYLSFVDDNHPHGSRQYEDFYTGVGITFSPISNALSVGGDILSNGSLYLTGTSTDENGDIHSFGGSDGHFGIFNEGVGPLWLNVKDSNNDTLVGIVSFSSESGSNFAARQSIFQSNINPRVTDTYDIGKCAQLQWNNVYANCFHGDGTGLTGTGFWEPDNKENLKAGTDAGSSINNHTCYNIFIGYEAGKNTASTAGGAADDGIADENIFIGKCSGHTNTTGGYNVFGGSNSGFCNTSGGCNVAFGNQAGYCNDTGSCNVFLGFCAGRYTLTGNDNIIMGHKAGFCNRVHSNNIFLGKYSGIRITGQDNIALGYSSLLGGASGENANTGQGNIAIGCATGKLLNDGNHSYNVFLGSFAGQAQRKGSYNVVIGASAEVADVNEGCQLVIGGTSGDAVNWLTGTCDGDIKPFRGIIDCSNSTGSTTETQVLTSTGTNIQWATNVAQAINSDKVGVGTTTNAGGDDFQSYYLPFVRDNNDHDDRQYEQLYSDSRLVFNYKASADRSFVGIGTTNPRAAILHLESDGPILRLTDRNAPTNNRHWHIATNTDNTLRFQAIDDSSDNDGSGAGGGDHFDFYREDENITEFRGVGAGTTWFVVDNKNLNVGIGTTNPIASDINTSLQTNTSVLAVGVVTAKEYYGTFKGTIDPDATITLDKIEEGDTSAEVVDTGTDGHFKVLTEGTERLRITSGGDVVVHHNSQDPTHSTSSGSIFLTPPSGTNPNRGIMWSNTSDTHYVKLEPTVMDGLTINGFSGVVFATGSRTGSPSTWRERFRIDSSGRIGLLDDTTGGTLKSDNFGTDNQVLTSKGPNAAAVWQTISGIPASTSNQLKITKTNNKGVLYLLGVQNANGEDTAEGNITTKTVYQKTQNTLFFDTITDTLRVPTIRGELVAGGSWPAIQGNLTIETNHLIPSSNVVLNSQGIVIDPLYTTNPGSNYGNGTVTNVATSGGTGTNLTVDVTFNGGVTSLTVNTGGTGYVVGDIISINHNSNTSATFKINAFNINRDITNGQNLGSATKKWAEVYAEKFVGHLGGTADSTKQVQLQKAETTGTAMYFPMASAAGENLSPISTTLYTDTALTYNPSSDTLQASNIKVTTKLNVIGNTVLGDQLSDTVTWNARSGTIQPSGTVADGTLDSNGYTDKNLGSTNYKWDTVYAKTFSGAFSGTADKADLVDVAGVTHNKDYILTFIDWNNAAPPSGNSDSDPAYKGLKFDAERNLSYNPNSNVLTVPNLAISGITTLGTTDSDKTIFNSKVASNIVPAPPASGQAVDRHNLGSETDLWGTVYATEFSGSMSGSASQVDTRSTTTIDGYVTFVQNNHDSTDPEVNLQSTVYTNSLLTYNSTAGSEILTVSGQLKVSKDAEFDEDVTLGHSAAEDKVTFKSKIAAPLDSNSKGSILPFTPGTVDGSDNPLAGIDLGGTSNYWRKIYALEFVGAITGNADTATALNPGAAINLTSGTYDATHDFSSAGTIKFTGASAYEVTAQLNSTGVTADTYGNTTGTSYATFTVDSKGRITSASTQAISLTGLTASKAQQVETITSTSTNAHYLTFVDSNNSTATAENVYTDGTLTYIPSTDTLSVSKFVPSGSFPTAAGKIPTTKQVGTAWTWEWGDGTASGIGRNYTLPLTTSTGSSGHAKWTLTDNVTPTPNTNAIQLNAGDGLTISSASPGATGGSFTISMDTSTNTAFKYKNGSTDASNTGKVAATLQIYPSAANGGGTDQVVTLTPGAGIKFTGQSAQALTIESDADVGASTVATTLATANSAHYLTFVSGAAAGTSKTLYQDSDSLTYNPSSNTLTTQDLSVTGDTTLGNANTDTVTWNAKSGTILPSGDLTNNVALGKNLGSATCKWDTIHAKNITGTLTVDTSDKQVLYTSGTGTNAVVAGSDNFTWDVPSNTNVTGVLKVSRDPDNPNNSTNNWAAITTDGCLEITRTHATVKNGVTYRGGAYIDFRDDPATSHDYIARMQVTTHMAGGLWNQNNDRGGILFETGGTNRRHMLLNKEGVLGITRGTDETAILTNNGTNHTSGFVPGMSRDSSVAAGHNISDKVVLDVNGTLMLRANTLNNLEGGQITLNNCEDTIAYSIDVYGNTAGDSLLRIIDEKTTTDAAGNDLGRGTQRVALSRTGAIGFGDVGNEDWGNSGDVLTSSGNSGKPYWHPSAGGVSGSKFRIYEANDAAAGAWPSYYPTSTSANGVYSTNVKFIMATAIGGGGGAGGIRGVYSNTENRPISGGGGGGGCATIIVPMSLMGFNTSTGKCDKIWMQIGSGGAGGTGGGYQGQSADGSDGQPTYFRWNWTNGSVWGSEIVGMGGGGSQRVDLVYDGYSVNSAKKNTWAGFSVGGDGGKYRRSDYGGQIWENRWLSPYWSTRDVNTNTHESTTNYTGRSGERGHFTGNLHGSGQFLTSYAPLNMRMKGGASGYGGHGPTTSDVGRQLGTSDERKWMDWGVGGDGAITEGLGYAYPTSNMGYGAGQKGWFGAVIIQEFF